ncbi:hypothetical protein CYY_008783 [Polysphondylium violaceum]|uniref:CWH43-like N-terminal domain-containing protein n=1 Tax=Polysphondylium violaceum TaxID=133409 RepID=A0A8J4PL59_9MYCE|nr:hypothetical protein CYY_008783 [Polysphondylium violaceum]
MTTMIKPKYLLWVMLFLPAATLIVTYTLTVKLHHDDMIIPFISSSINFAPESCIGALGISITSFILVLIIFVKYLIGKFNILNDPYTQDEKRRHITNKACLGLGLISAFGMNGVASFQYHNAPIPHIVFATLFFLFGVVYLLIQTYMDSITKSLPRGMMIFRRINSIASLFFFIPYLVFQFFEKAIYQNIAAAFEILSAATFFLYFITYFYEFSQLKLNIDFSYQLRNSTATHSPTSPLLGFRI